ncbi:MAG: hypothetical protein Q8Q24_00280 [bacterium]|nr:hypothetical protein [bacterium]
MNLAKDKIYLTELKKIIPDTPKVRNLSSHIESLTTVLEATIKEWAREVEEERKRCQHEETPLYLRLTHEDKEVGVACGKCGYSRYFNPEEFLNKS